MQAQESKDVSSSSVSKRRLSTRSWLLALWLMMIFGTLYGAGDLRGWALKHQVLGRSEWVQRTTSALLQISQSIGLQWVRRSVRGVMMYNALSTYLLRQPEYFPAKRPVKRRLTPNKRRPVTTRRVRKRPVKVRPKVPLCKGLAKPPKGHRREKPVRNILLVGSSSINHYLGTELERRLESYHKVRVFRLRQVGTGLARPDYFDWQSKIKELVEKVNPVVTITLFGRNDTQPLTSKDRKQYIGLGTRAWEKEYYRRHVQFMESMRAKGGEVIVLGNPVMKSDRVSKWMRLFNKIIKKAARKVGAHFLPLWMLSATPKGEYRKRITFEKKTGLMRMSDGSHFTLLGSKFMAAKIAERLVGQLQLLKKDEVQRTFRYSFDSRFLQRKVSYLAYMPKDALDESMKKRFPVVYLLHGAGDDWRAWSERAHEDLLALSEKHKVVIVTPDGDIDSWYLDSPIQKKSQYASYLIKELIPDVHRHLPVTCQRAISGLSMGGHGAFTLALKHPKMFVAASSMSGVMALSSSGLKRTIKRKLGSRRKFPKRWKQHSATWLIKQHPKDGHLPKLYFSVGRYDRLRYINRKMRRLLKKRKIPHQYDESRGRHDWKYWTKVLPKHLSWLAQQLRSSSQ